MTNVSVVAFWEVTVNDTLPLCALIVRGGEEPLILALESLFCSEIAKLSSPVRLLLQSRNSTEMVTALFMSDVFEERNTCESSRFGFPAQDREVRAVLHESTAVVLDRKTQRHAQQNAIERSVGDDENTGVVNHRGEVHGHPDLYVADGSIVPASGIWQ